MYGFHSIAMRLHCVALNEAFVVVVCECFGLFIFSVLCSCGFHIFHVHFEQSTMDLKGTRSKESSYAMSKGWQEGGLSENFIHLPRGFKLQSCENVNNLLFCFACVASCIYAPVYIQYTRTPTTLTIQDIRVFVVGTLVGTFSCFPLFGCQHFIKFDVVVKR